MLRPAVITASVTTTTRRCTPRQPHFELPQSETTREAGEYVAEPPLLANRIAPIPVRLVDERFTTTTAHGALRLGGKDSRARRQVVDAAAAAVLLQAALDTERGTGYPPGELVTEGPARD